MTILRRSDFIHVIAVGEASSLVLHAVSQTRVTVTPEIARLIEAFAAPTALADAVPRLANSFGCDETTIQDCIRSLVQRGILTEQSGQDERATVAQELAAGQGRDPEAQLVRWRRSQLQGSHPYWAVTAPQGLDSARGLRWPVDVLLFGDCDVQMETDFLRREAARRGIDLHAAASFASDTDLAADHAHDLIIIGALQARHAITLGEPRHHDGDPARVYIDAARAMLAKLRAVSDKPILLDGLPEPTLQPLGLADRGVHSHRNRFRRTNLALAELADEFTDVFLVDIAATLGAAGSATMLDDGLVGFTHFGSPGWMLQRPASEMGATHHLFPDMDRLADDVGGNPYRREEVIARAHVDTAMVALGIDRKKCVIVDLDGVLWPGVLAETGSPFAWTPEISSANSYVGLYFGIHEALRALRNRGLLLACVSKNDMASVRSLWQFPEHYPRHKLLSPADFVTMRVNWQDKASNIRSIAEELGFALDSFIFIDDSAHEREQVRHYLPEIAVLGENLFELRRALLSDPRLQPARLTSEAAGRSDLVKAQLERAQLRRDAAAPDDFLASLNVISRVEQLTDSTDGGVLGRVRELFERTTQCNATARTFTIAELERLASGAESAVFTLAMRDRLADHGLVGAAVVVAGEIRTIALSCRVIGLGGERVLLEAIRSHAEDRGWTLRGEIIETARNIPVRHLYRDNGFEGSERGWWTAPARAGRPTNALVCLTT